MEKGYDIREQGVVRQECSRCHEKRPCKFVNDPFLEDVHNEIVKKWYCKDCYQETCDDI